MTIFVLDSKFNQIWLTTEDTKKMQHKVHRAGYDIVFELRKGKAIDNT